MTKFESIQEAALRVLDLQNCPELVKEMLLKMVADEESLVHFAEMIAMMNIVSPNFRELLRTAEKATTAQVLDQLIKRIEGMNNDNRD